MNEFLFLGPANLRAFEIWGTNLCFGILAAVYMILRRKRGDSARIASWMCLGLLFVLALPGVSYFVKSLCGFERARNWNECFPIALFIGLAFDEFHRELRLQGWRRIVVLGALLLLIPMGLTVGERWTTDNISKSKSFSGANQQTQELCHTLHEIYGEDDLQAVLPREFQKEVGIDDLGVRCPYVDWNKVDNTTANYAATARDEHVRIVVIPFEVAWQEQEVVSGNGLRQDGSFEHYGIYTYTLLEE